MNLPNRDRAAGTFLWLGFIFLHALRAYACGPNFPNEMLDRGDEAVLAAPIADFSRELERIHVLPANFKAVLTTNDYAIQTIEADVEDLRRALGKTELSKAERERIALTYQSARVQLAGSQTSRAKTNDSDASVSEGEAKSSIPAEKAPASIIVPAGLPQEFADYFRGSIAWHAGRTNEARTDWETLLELPESERRFRSTWAAYMLGRYWQDTEEKKAIEYFQKVRALASAGFADRLGLAAASLGWEARAELHQKHFDRAIQLYLQQLASGDGSATESLRTTASKALVNGGDPLATLATNTESRRVVTAYIISRKTLESLFDDYALNSETNHSIVAQWLDAVEAANVTDVESAEQLALAAYQSGHWELAQRWIDRAKTTPVTEWLEAKLLLRSGKIEAAAALLEKVARGFPLDDSVTNRPEPVGLKDNLFIPGFTYVSFGDIFPSAQVLAELGTLHLARREYTEALDALLRSGFWMDAAYVAERVLTVEELKNYVDRDWAPVAPANASTNANEVAANPRRDMRREIRYLLARRLTRTQRGNEASDYYPAEHRADFAALLQNEAIQNNPDSSTNQRAAALFEMAKLVRHQGMELIGTEVEPDWHIFEGQYEGNLTGYRATNVSSVVTLASEEEIQRAQQHGTKPNERFHYRYQAAALAWAAATLMPNNDEQTARVLCTGGTWIKNLDGERADVFYKALVRRCRKTEIGQLADRMRWFPILDENGKLIPWNAIPPQEVETPQSEAQHAPGYWYILNRGNTLEDVVMAVNAAHQLALTVEDIQQANPGINPNRLKTGQRIFVSPSTPRNPEQEAAPTTNNDSGSVN